MIYNYNFRLSVHDMHSVILSYITSRRGHSSNPNPNPCSTLAQLVLAVCSTELELSSVKPANIDIRPGDVQVGVPVSKQYLLETVQKPTLLTDLTEARICPSRLLNSETSILCVVKLGGPPSFRRVPKTSGSLHTPS